MLKKDENFDGYNFRELIAYGDIKGHGNVFATAQSNVGNSKEAKFDLTRVKCYAFANIGGELIEASRKKDKASFMSALTRTMDSAASALGKKISHQIYRSQYGNRGTVLSVSGYVITLTNAGDHAMFEIGDSLLFSATDGSALGNNTAASVTHIVRGESTSTLTLDATCASVDCEAGDYIYLEADTDATAGAVGTGLSISGLEAWLPAAHPTTGDSFFGLDRSVDTRLGGLIYDGSSKTIIEALTRGVNFANSQGAKISHVVIPYKNFADLVDLLGTRAQITTEKAYKNPQIGFSGVELMSNKGPVKVFADQFCPADVAFGLTLDTWTLRSLNKCPHILDLDSSQLLRMASEDSYQIRWGSYHQLGCTAPGWNIRIKL